MCHRPRHAPHGIVPPHILRHLAHHGSEEERRLAVDTLMSTELLQGERHALGQAQGEVPAGQKRRTLYDARHTQSLPGELVRGENDAADRDPAVNEALTGWAIPTTFTSGC